MSSDEAFLLLLARASKRAAGRPKDLAVLPTLEDSLRLKRAL